MWKNFNDMEGLGLRLLYHSGVLLRDEPLQDWIENNWFDRPEVDQTPDVISNYFLEPDIVKLNLESSSFKAIRHEIISSFIKQDPALYGDAHYIVSDDVDLYTYSHYPQNLYYRVHMTILRPDDIEEKHIAVIAFPVEGRKEQADTYIQRLTES